MRPPIMTSSQVAHCQSKLTEHCITANKDGVSNIKKCIPVDPSIIHACVQHTYLHMHNTLYSPSEGIRKRERLEYIHAYVYNIHIFTCTFHVHCTLYSPSQGIRKRERETGMPPWAGPGTGRETRAGFLVPLDSKLYFSRPSVFVVDSSI